MAGLAAGHTMAAMPTYFTEVAPPHSRGLITAAHAVFINIGYCISGWIGYHFTFPTLHETLWFWLIEILDLVAISHLSRNLLGVFHSPLSLYGVLASSEGHFMVWFFLTGNHKSVTKASDHV